MDKLHIKTAETDVIARFFRKDLSVFQKIPFFQLQLNERCGQYVLIKSDNSEGALQALGSIGIQNAKTDTEGNIYELYVIENHVQQEERFTPEKQAQVDGNIEKQRGDIDYMAMILDVELEV